MKLRIENCEGYKITIHYGINNKKIPRGSNQGRTNGIVTTRHMEVFKSTKGHCGRARCQDDDDAGEQDVKRNTKRA